MENIELNQGPVRIAVRERPMVARELESECESVVYSKENILIVDEKPFIFDNVIGLNENQESVYNEIVKPLIVKLLQGFNCTMMAYGQTGSGKTFTMGLHTDSFEGDSAGMISRSLQDVFNFGYDGLAELETHITFIEIYNEKVYDLLAENFSEPINTKGCKFPGGTKKLVTCLSDAKKLLIDGNKNRHIRPTKMNSFSSRSHAIFTIHVLVRKENSHTISSLHLVDLAGSEGVKRTGHEGAAYTEGIHINQGLLSVRRVLEALSLGNKVIPYRDSILSTVLQDSLNANSYLTLLACISPTRDDLSETVSTLRFVQHAKSLKNTPKMNAVMSDYKKSHPKTPLKLYTAPLRAKNAPITPASKRKFEFLGPRETSTIKRPNFHSNTFSSPSSVKKTINRTNNTFCTPSKIRKIDFKANNRHTVTDVLGISRIENVRNNKFPRESTDLGNHSIDSNFSLNASTSTVVDGPPFTTISYSPIVKKCMETLQTNFDERLKQMFETLQTTILGQTMSNKTIINKKRVSSRSSSNSNSQNSSNEGMDNTTVISVSSTDNNQRIIKNIENVPNITAQEIKDIIKSELQLFQSATLQNVQQLEKVVNNENQSPEDDVFLMPAMPIMQLNPLESISPIHIIPQRRSRRISSILVDATNNPRPVRRSIRLQSIEMERPKIVDPPTRRSMRIETIAVNRQSLTNKIHLTTTKVTKTSKKNPLTDYFINGPARKVGIKDARKQHKDSILKLLNKGTLKELQILPLIGLKTAYQIIFQRTLHGDYKDLEHVSKLPIFKGKAWERFQNANSLL